MYTNKTKIMECSYGPPRLACLLSITPTPPNPTPTPPPPPAT